ncbi:hypothetical protein BJY52DRAFT_1195946 [Lactarius psammicola]|nr:hypothetical protein BJY52DRAFT_1195946 [Lactarius psammicola]
MSDLQTDIVTDPIADEAYSEDEDDWIDDQAVVGHTHGQSAQLSETTANERPTWKGSSTATGFPSVTGTTVAPALASPTETVTPTEVPATTPPPSLRHVRDSVTTESPSAWPLDTELSFAPGTTKFMLTIQRPVVCIVIQDAIEHVRASILFKHAFPDSTCAFTFIRDALITAAYAHRPVALNLHRWLQQDEEADVKERCNAITLTTFLAITSPDDIVSNVRHQLSDYNYTFPAASSGVTRSLMRRTQPYRNDRIFKVIRDLYFTGGSTSFATRFGYLFPTTEGSDGKTRHEVPIPMVALVATALYATIYEWRTGEQQIAEFSANVYLDVYNGHINTLLQIRERHVGAFHSMMAEIYSQVSTLVGVGVSLGVPTAVLDFDELED